MADKVVLTAEIDSNIGEVSEGLDKAADSAERLEKGTKKGTSGFKGMGTAVKGIGTALKAAGIGLVVALFAKLMEMFSKNQKVLDTFNTAMTALNIAFSDLFKFIENNIGAVIGYFKSIFEDPKQAVIDFGNMIKDNLIERFNSLLDVFGHLGKALGHLFKGEFKGEFSEAFDSVTEAGKEYVDVLTGVDGTVDKITETVTKATDAIVDYTKSTLDSAAAITELSKKAELNRVLNQGLIEDFDRQAELQRQIRDDETRTFADRIKANEDLGVILEKQEKLMLANAQASVDYAQAQKDILDNDENKIALQEALNEQAAITAQITGFQSEQLTNQVALEKELREAKEEVLAAGLNSIELELAELERSYQEKLRMANKSGMDITAITKLYEQQKEQIVQSGVNAQLSAYSNLGKALGSLAGESKALAVATAIMDTYVAANKALGDSTLPSTTLRFISAAAVIINGLANVKKIMQTNVPGGGGGGGSVGATPQPPSQQMVSGQFSLEGGTAPEPVQAYVVSDDITNNQDKLAAIRRRATI